MEQYIKKSDLLAEIMNRIKELQNLYKENEEKFDSILKTAILLCIDECKVILSLIDTLEVKGVDLNEEIEKCLKKYSMLAAGKKDFTDIAKHFFELGLKVAQKGE